LLLLAGQNYRRITDKRIHTDVDVYPYVSTIITIGTFNKWRCFRAILKPI